MGLRGLRSNTMITSRFTKPFTQQEPLSNEAIENAIAVMQGGRLHRYNVLEGETSHASLLEQEFATYQEFKILLSLYIRWVCLYISPFVAPV